MNPFVPGDIEKEQDEVWDHMQKHVRLNQLKKINQILDNTLARSAQVHDLMKELKAKYAH